MSITCWKTLRAAFEKEIAGEWSAIYPQPEFVEMIVKRVFFYYDRSKNYPKDRDGWRRALEKFLREEWLKTSQNKVAEFRKNEFKPSKSKPGIQYSGEPTKISCDFCHDLKVIWAYSLDDSHDTLMLCSCADPIDQSNWGLPQWENRLGSIYRKDACPLEWFKPMTFNGSTENIWAKAHNWRNRIRMAEEQWIKIRTANEAGHQS